VAAVKSVWRSVKTVGEARLKKKLRVGGSGERGDNILRSLKGGGRLRRLEVSKGFRGRRNGPRGQRKNVTDRERESSVKGVKGFTNHRPDETKREKKSTG